MFGDREYKIGTLSDKELKKLLRLIFVIKEYS